MVSERVGPTKIGLGLIGILTLLAAGGAMAAAFLSPAAPTLLRPQAEFSSFPIGTASFEDIRTVRLSASRHPDISLTAPASGLVTSHSCIAGGELTSGTSPLSIDDKPVVALSTAIPLWRDLAVGDKGRDVSALQEELSRLGYPVQPTGTVGRVTIGAVNDLLADVGDLGTVVSVPRGRFLWIPEASVKVAQCALTTGGVAVPGDEIVTVAGGLMSVSLLDPVPGDLIDGPRVLVIDGTQVAIDPTAPITDPGLLDQLAMSPSLRSTGAEGEAEPPVGQLKLAEPLSVSVIPPSAVYIAEDGASCVTSNGEARRVTVVGSELGQTFAVFEAGAPLDVDTIPRESVPCT